MFEWLTKYPVEYYGRGAISLDWPWTQAAAAVAAIVALSAFALGYRHLRAASRGRRATLASLRAAALAIVLVLVLQPVLTVDRDEATRGHVAILLDDSLSMGVGEPGATPADQLAALFPEAGDGGLGALLEARFETRRYRFGAALVRSPDGIVTGTQARSDLAAALSRLAGARATGDTLASVVVVTDGALDGASADTRAVARLRAAGVPVHVVVLDEGRPGVDAQVLGVRLPERMLGGDEVDAEVEIITRGEMAATLVIEDNGRVIDSAVLSLGTIGEELRHTVRRRLRFDAPGERRLTARLAPVPVEQAPTTDAEPAAGIDDAASAATPGTQASALVAAPAAPLDIVPGNDIVGRSVAVRGRPLRVLHYEGEPRFEVKFLRRALDDDESLSLTSLVRTAENKHFRLGIERPEELIDGFPSTPEALMRYDVIVLGSVPAHLFSEAQLDALHDFVSRRGGGLVLLGGAGQFGRGGHDRTVIADLSPVVIGAQRSADDENFAVMAKARPTAAGRISPILALHPERSVGAVFERLPELAVIHPLRRAKPAANVLLTADDGGPAPLVLLAEHRYGRGSVASFAVRNSWRWQMHSEVPLDDLTHERLWRQLIRALGRPAPSRLSLFVEPAGSGSDAVPGDPVTVRVEVLDAAYRPLVAAAADTVAPTLSVTTPLGDVSAPELHADPAAPGSWTAQFVVEDSGAFELQAEFVDTAADTLGAVDEALGDRDGGSAPVTDAAAVVAALADAEPLVARAGLDVSAAGDELRDYAPRLDALGALTARTGGSLHRSSAGDVGRELLAQLSDVRETRRVTDRLPLWDVPLLLLLLLALVCSEWLLRRRWGAA